MLSFKEQDEQVHFATCVNSLFSAKKVTHNSHRRLTATEIYAAAVLSKAKRQKQISNQSKQQN